jgi:hypothetical protein
MRARGTRGQILSSLEQCERHLNKVLENLQRADERAQGRHPVLNDHLPEIVGLTNGLLEVITKLRGEI